MRVSHRPLGHSLVLVMVLYEIIEDLLRLQIVLYEWEECAVDNFLALFKQRLPHLQELRPENQSLAVVYFLAET